MKIVTIFVFPFICIIERNMHRGDCLGEVVKIDTLKT